MRCINEFEPLWGIWRIESELGAGSYGKVYKAIRKDFDQEYHCAIKHISVPQDENELKQYLHENLTSDMDQAAEYFKQIVESVVEEISVMYAVKGNTNIVSYEEHQVIPAVDGIGYDILIKMELLTGLTEYLNNNPFTQADAIKLGIDICTALEICASKNLIHRDIKPQNIFVSAAGNYKLGDFGIARTLEQTSCGLSKKGTYSYMAPEVYKGESYGASADIYSLGLVLYRLMNQNRLPFYPQAPTPIRFEDNEYALRQRMWGETFPEPILADKNLARVIKRMCAYRRNERYLNAADVKAELLALRNIPMENKTLVGSYFPDNGCELSGEIMDSLERTVDVFVPRNPVRPSDTNEKKAKEKKDLVDSDVAPGLPEVEETAPIVNSPPTEGPMPQGVIPTDEMPTVFSPIIPVIGLSVTSDGIQKHHTVNKFPCIIGRSSKQSTILLTDEEVSRAHARLSLDDGDFYITDLESANGVIVNGERISPNVPTKVQDGTILLLGQSNICIEVKQ